jgi:hypothetical protein
MERPAMVPLGQLVIAKTGFFAAVHGTTIR